METRVKKYDVVVSGAGPAGLIAALQAIKVGKTVLVIEQRENKKELLHTRPQTITLVEASIECLLEFFPPKDKRTPDDIRFIDSLDTADESGYYYSSIKDLERFLQRRLEEQGSKCSFMYGTKISSIDMKESEVLVKKTTEDKEQEHEKIKFKYLVGADGSQHSTAKLLEDKIQYEVIHVMHNKNFVTAHFILSENKGSAFELPETRHSTVLSDDSVSRIFLNMPSHLKKDKKAVKFYIGMSIISEEKYLEFEKDEKKGIAYLKKQIEKIYPAEQYSIARRDPKLTQLKKEKLKYQTFCFGKIYKANKAVIKEGEALYVLIGDSFRTPDPLTGRGIGDIFIQAQAFKNLLQNGGIEQYEKACLEASHNSLKDTIALENYIKYEISGYKLLSEYHRAPTIAPLEKLFPIFVTPFHTKLSLLHLAFEYATATLQQLFARIQEELLYQEVDQSDSPTIQKIAESPPEDLQLFEIPPIVENGAGYALLGDISKENYEKLSSEERKQMTNTSEDSMREKGWVKLKEDKDFSCKAGFDKLFLYERNGARQLPDGTLVIKYLEKWIVPTQTSVGQEVYRAVSPHHELIVENYGRVKSIWIKKKDTSPLTSFFRWQSIQKNAELKVKEPDLVQAYTYYKQYHHLSEYKFFEKFYQSALAERQRLTKPYVEKAVDTFSLKKGIAHLPLFKKFVTDFLEREDAASLQCIAKPTKSSS